MNKQIYYDEEYIRRAKGRYEKDFIVIVADYYNCGKP